ncbi:cytochrome P450 71D11-like [Pistacia vera]|uniref:cytochrome P450 71D11-like n=1 Tax=Pistacia vera TaxID=55513 RepID=UPI0012630BFF|nr:cytochrome P450 71D11-like [Pistacia vera]
MKLWDGVTKFLVVMELQFQSFTLILTFLLFLFTSFKILKRPEAQTPNSKKPPGPLKLPLIGNLHQLGGSLPHHRLRDLARKYGPFMHLQLGEVSMVVVSSPEYAREVMKTHDINFASRPQTVATNIMSYDSTDIICSPYGDYWRQLRKICTLELFSARRVQSFRSIREEEVATLIDWVGSNAGSPINLTEKIASLIYGITSRAAFGGKSKDQELFISLMEETLKVTAGFSISELFPSINFLQWITGVKSQLEKLHQEADRIVEKIINDHKKRRETLNIDKSGEAEDLVDVLLKVQQHGDLQFPLTMDNIKAVVLDIFAAGGETSATTIDWAMCEMMKNTRVLEKAQAEVREIFNREGKIDETSVDEMKYLKLVIKETLRLHPPAPLLIPRECRQNCVINGFDIPIKTRVIVNAWAIGRDPEYWSEPEIFNPERFLNHSVDYKGTSFEYIPFGAGRRVCPGMSFGLANVELPLAMFLYHFDWKLPSGMKNEDLDMTEAFGINSWKKRQPAHYSHSLSSSTFFISKKKKQIRNT